MVANPRAIYAIPSNIQIEIMTERYKIIGANTWHYGLYRNSRYALVCGMYKELCPSHALGRK
ncbi:MAG: hypothetical protein WAM14_02400 [Candidatus Nitrosopolaris sp.]